MLDMEDTVKSKNKEMAIDANKKKQAKAKIEQSNGIPDYAKDPELEAEIEKALS